MWLEGTPAFKGAQIPIPYEEQVRSRQHVPHPTSHPCPLCHCITVSLLLHFLFSSWLISQSNHVVTQLIADAGGESAWQRCQYANAEWRRTAKLRAGHFPSRVGVSEYRLTREPEGASGCRQGVSQDTCKGLVWAVNSGWE